MNECYVVHHRWIGMDDRHIGDIIGCVASTLEKAHKFVKNSWRDESIKCEYTPDADIPGMWDYPDRSYKDSGTRLITWIEEAAFID